MRIVILAPSLRLSGGNRIMLGYASRLAARGHEVTLAVLLADPLRRLFYNLLGVAPRWFHGHSAKVLRVAAYNDDSLPDADVLVATSVPTALLSDTLSMSKGKKFLLLQHDEGLYHFSRADADRSYRLPMRKIVVATWLRDLLREKYSQETDLMINPVDREQFHRYPRSKEDGTIRIGLLHHTYAWKGTTEGARIVLDLKKKYPSVRLIVFGARRRHVDILCDEYHYDLPQDKLAQFYSNLDIFLCPSWDEGFGLPSIEAMTCGAALVTYDNGGSRDFAIDGKTAMVAPRRDEAALEKKLETLIVDESLRTRIAEEGKRFVDAMPGWDERTRQLEEILSK